MKNENSVFLIKKLKDTNINAVLKVVTQNQDSDYKNAIITFYRIRDKNANKLENNNKILYKKE